MNLSKLARTSSNAGCLTLSQYPTDFFQNLLWISLVVLKKLLQFIRPIENSTYRIHDPTGIKFVNRLRAGFSDLQEHKLRYNFVDTLNPLMYMCSRNWMYWTLFSALPQLHLIANNPDECCNDILGVICVVTKDSILVRRKEYYPQLLNISKICKNPFCFSFQFFYLLVWFLLTWM